MEDKIFEWKDVIMRQEQFMNKMIDLLDSEEEIKMHTKLKDLKEWDSLSYVSFLAMANVTAGKNLNPETIKKAKTIADLFEMVRE